MYYVQHILIIKTIRMSIVVVESLKIHKNNTGKLTENLIELATKVQLVKKSIK